MKILFKILSSRSIFLFVFVSCFAFGKSSQYLRSKDPGIRNDSIVKLIIDPLVLNDKDEALFVEALTALAIKKKLFDTITVMRKQTVDKAITDKSKYSIFKSGSFSKIRKAVKKINNLDDKLLIYTNQQLFYPKIPVHPIKDSPLEQVQVFDIENGKQYIQDSKAVIEGDNSIILSSADENARLWMYKMNRNDLEFVMNMIPLELRNNLIGNAFLIDDEKLQFSEIYKQNPLITENSQFFQPLKVSDELKLKLKEISVLDFGKYYILDNHSADICDHGNNVVSIVKQRLAELEITLDSDHIIPIQVNLLEDIKKSIEDIEMIVSNSNNLFDLPNFDIKMQVSKLKKLTKKQILEEQQKCGECISDFFLDLILKYYYSQKPDLLSTSLYVRSSRSVKPIFTTDSNTNFVTAALNDNSPIEDILLNKSNLIEPLMSCYTSYGDFGSIIVGNSVSTGKFSGNYSNSGRVSTLGIGGGYKSLTACYGDSYTGTSFATPDVAVKLFIAKAYWRSKNLKPFPNAIEARRRMILSSDIQEEFVGKFASGGIPNLEKLLVVTNGFTEDLDGKIGENIIIEMPSTISYNTVDKRAFGAEGDRISGLSFSGTKTFAFFEKDLLWREIYVDAIDLKIEINGIKENFTDINYLKSKYKQIVKLKN